MIADCCTAATGSVTASPIRSILGAASGSLRKLVLGVALATGAVTGMSVVATPAQAQQTTTFQVWFNYFDGTSFTGPYFLDESGDENYANNLAGQLNSYPDFYQAFVITVVK